MKRYFEHPYVRIAIAGLCVWAATLAFGFVWDDFPMIVNNSSLHQWKTLVSGWSHDFWGLHDTPQTSGYWRPVATMFHVLLTQLIGTKAWVFHLFNVTLHLCTAIFFYRFLVQAKIVKWLWIPVLFFIWHPISAETVSFNSAVPDLLCAFFGWAAVATFTDQTSSRRKKTILTFLFLILSFLSKETGVFFGFFIIGIDFLLLDDQKKPAYAQYAAIVGLIALYVFLHKVVIHTLGIRNSLWGGDLAHHTATVCKLLIYQLMLLIFPWGSSPTRDFAIVDFTSPWAWAGASLLLMMIGLFFYWRKSKPVWAFVIFFYLVFWFPVSNIIPAEGLIVDRYMYVISMAMALAIGIALSRSQKFPGAVVFILAGYAIWALGNSLAWSSSESLWRHATRSSTQSSVAWNEWGNVLSSKQDYKEAYDAYTKAITLKPQYRDASINRAFASFSMHESQSKQLITDHVNQFPDDAQGYDLLGAMYENESNLQNAAELSQKAIELAPNEWKYKYNLAEVYLRQKKYDQAIVQLQIVADQARGHFEVVKNLAAAYCMNGQYQECVDTYREFMQKFPEKSQDVTTQLDQAQKLLELTQEK